MFVYSIRASTIKFFIVIVLTLAILVGIFAVSEFTEVSAASQAVNFSGIKTAEDRIEFISQFIPEISGEELYIKLKIMPLNAKLFLLYLHAFFLKLQAILHKYS